MERRIKKFKLPNKSTLIVHVNVLHQFEKYRQAEKYTPESGGFLLGYQNSNNDSILLDNITLPQSEDNQGLVSFLLNDKKHFQKLDEFRKEGSYFIGTWHTHPQDFVNPSLTDRNDWKKSIKHEKSAADFMIFIIVGRKEIGVWVGNENQKILRIREG